MTSDASRDPADGTLVEREGVNAGSAQGSEEADGDTPSLVGGSTTGLAGDRVEEPSQVWAGSSGAADPDAAYGSESGQDDGLLG